MSQITPKTADYKLTDLAPALQTANKGKVLLESLPVWLNAQTRKSAGRGRSADNTLQYGVQKLRELILELAVQGKLVPQDPNDEPASILLEKITEKKARLVNDGEIKKPKAFKPNEESLLENIPSGWANGFMPMVVETDRYAIKRGPFGSALKKAYFVKSGYKVYEQQHAIKDDFSLGNYYISEEKFEELKAFEVHPGDLIISCSGTIGRVAEAPKNMEPGVINQALLKISLNQNALINDYFKILFAAFFMQTETLSDLQGTAQKNMVSVETLKNEAFPLPPLAEQYRIVKKVDELMALCDQLEQKQADAVQAHDTLVKVLLETITQSENAEDFQQNWRRIAEHFGTLFTTESSIDKLKQTLLQLAVMGKLVLQDPNDEPVSVLITRVQEYLIQQTSSKHLPKLKRDKSVYEPEHYQHQVPSTWEWVELQGIFLFTNGKAHEQFVNEKGKFVLINSKFVSNSGRIRKHVSERLTPLETGDISIVMSDVPNGRALARCYLIEENDIYTLNQRIGGLKTSPELDRNYLLLALDRHPYMLAYNDGQKQTNLKKVQIMSAPVPIPPLAEQHRIVKKVDDLMTLCNQLKDRLNQAQTLQQQLADAVAESTINLK